MRELSEYQKSQDSIPAVTREIWADLCREYQISGEPYEYGVGLSMTADQKVEVVRPPFIVERRDLKIMLPGEVDLALRRINPSSFEMGTPEGEVEYHRRLFQFSRLGKEIQHRVALTGGGLAGNVA